MKHLLLTAGVIGSLLMFIPGLAAQPAAPPAPSVAEQEVRAVVQRVTTKLRAGETSAAALASELAEFDALIEKYRGEAPDDAAGILLLKASLFLQVLNDHEKGLAVLQQIKTEFPQSQPAAMVDQILAQDAQRREAEQAKTALVGQPAPELNFEWATREGLKTLSGLRGKVVVLDFWATWCGPCVASFPQIRELTDHYRGYDVEIIGVTSLQGRVHGLGPQPIDCRGDPAKERNLMTDYVKAQEINWSIAFSEQPVFNPAFGVTGIPHMAIVGPDGRVRHNGLHPGALSLSQKTQLIDALLQEAGLRVPAKR
jgi:thiol-disulfide isomerase/thioredoxin